MNADKAQQEQQEDENIRYYTIGYGGLDSIQDIYTITQNNSISLILDVRSKPNTRKFSKTEFEKMFGDSYVSRPDMGGLGFTGSTEDQYADWLKVASAGLQVTKDYASNPGRRVLIMCAEKNPDTCHRKYFVGRALEEAGYGVKHL